MEENYVWIKTQKEGFHKWKDAIEDVKFLSYPHRHIFHFKVYIEVNHNERDIEFILFKRFVEDKLKEIWEEKKLYDYDKCEGASCETLSDNLHSKIINKYPNRKIKIEVSEDDENGSFKIYKIS